MFSSNRILKCGAITKYEVFVKLGTGQTGMVTDQKNVDIYTYNAMMGLEGWGVTEMERDYLDNHDRQRHLY